MAVCMVFTPPKELFTDEHYERVLAHMGDGFPPPEMSLHLKGKTETGEVRIIDVFESADEFRKFAEGHAPVYEAMGISVEDVLKHASFFEIEKTIVK